MKIVGAEGLTVAQVEEQIAQGARFVMFQYVISLLLVTLRRSSDIHYIKPGESAAAKSLPYTGMSLLLGWWGFPWGFIRTPQSIFNNLNGGKDVTNEVLQSFRASALKQ